MKAYEMAKKKFYVHSFFTASHPALLFRTIKSLMSIRQGKQNDKELAIGCKAFVRYFTDKVLLLYQDVSATIETIDSTVRFPPDPAS